MLEHEWLVSNLMNVTIAGHRSLTMAPTLHRAMEVTVTIYRDYSWIQDLDMSL